MKTLLHSVNLIALGLTSAVNAAPLSHLYTDPIYLTKIPFGSHSHWLQPWRAYLETMPAQVFLQGTGVVLNLGNTINPDLVLQMLSKHGIRHARIEIGWANIVYDHENRLSNSSYLEKLLQACKKWGVRPLILLNANQGVPGPMLSVERRVVADAGLGARTLQLDNTQGLIIGKSGISNLTDYWAAEALITNINGATVTLSKPLPKPLVAGTTISIATLKYLPFGKPGSPEYTETIAGWQRYVDTVATFTAQTLGTTHGTDRGFDLESWNELTFGTQFLSINNYYTPQRYPYDEKSIWRNLVQATADYATAQSEKFVGVNFSDGFANTIPWTASSLEPARIRAISKHPYSGRITYPKSEYGGVRLDAMGQPTQYAPSYTALFPEYLATALQTETMIRDLAPITTPIYRTQHGRNARIIQGQVSPVPVWITEVNIAPNEVGITDRAVALALKAKTTARYFPFYLNKGVERLYLFAAAGGDLSLGIVQDNFLAYSRTNSHYPSDDTAYVSPALALTSRMVAKFQPGLDLMMQRTRSLSIQSLSDLHNHAQFGGDGTAWHPSLYNRELFTFLPYQVNAKRFVIPYYVMTRDIANSCPGALYLMHRWA